MRKVVLSSKSSLIQSLAVTAALGWATATSMATPYASGVTNNGTSVSFILNESADNVSVITNSPDGISATNSLGALSAGTYSFGLGGATNYSIAVSKQSPPGWRTHFGYVSNIINNVREKAAVPLQVSDNMNSNVVFNSARGLAINKNPASPFFGRVYVANSAASAVPFTNAPPTIGRLGYRLNGVGDGIYVLNADLSDPFGSGIARTAGLDTVFTATGSTAPYRMVVGDDDMLFICGQGVTNSANLWMTDPNVSPGSGTNVFGSMVNNPSTNTFPIGTDNNHGGLESVWMSGSLTAGNAVFYCFDLDAQDDRTSTTRNQLNSLWSNKGPAGTGNGFADLPITTAMNHPWTPASKYNVGPLISDFERGGPSNLLYMTMFKDDGDPIRVFNPGASFASVYTSPGKETAYTISLAPDGTSYAAVGKRSDGSVWIEPLDGNGALRDSRRSLLWTSGIYPTGYASGGSYRVRQVRFDVAYNLYVIEDNMPLRVYSPGGGSLATTSGDATTATSSGFNVVFGPAITLQPTTSQAGPVSAVTNITATAGLPTTIAVQGDYMTNVPAFAKQWYKDGVALVDETGHISGAAGSSLILTPVSCAQDNGAYWYVSANEIGSATSVVMQVTVRDPGIVSSPVNQTNVAGSTAQFSVIAAGSAPILYQWKRGTNALVDGPTGSGSIIDGATNSLLNIQNISIWDATNGSYSVVVSSGAGSCATNVATSSARTLTVVYPPAITNQPQTVVVTLGSNATFTARFSGTPPFTYDWEKIGWGMLTSGTVTSNAVSLTITNAQFTDRGEYYLNIGNMAGSDVSSNAYLAVNVPAPIIQPLTVTTGPNVSITWSTIVDGTYQVQYATNLPTSNWFTLTNIVATDVITNIIDTPNPADPQRYYRVIGQ